MFEDKRKGQGTKEEVKGQKERPKEIRRGKETKKEAKG
jgi:hypothetical protein